MRRRGARAGNAQERTPPFVQAQGRNDVPFGGKSGPPRGPLASVPLRFLRCLPFGAHARARTALSPTCAARRHGRRCGEAGILDVPAPPWVGCRSRPAGALTSTVNDPARFDEALLTGKLLPKAQLAEMTKAGPFTVDPTDPTKGYGLGLKKLTLCGVSMWGHTGAVLGTKTAAFTSAGGTRQLVPATDAGPDTWTADQISAWLAASRTILCVR
ncbi:serine hydrolase [Streptomyces spiralis]